MATACAPESGKMEDHSNNFKALTLGSNGAYKINNNCSELKVGDGCTVSCDNNCGKIELGANTVVTSSNNNCGHVVIGDYSTVTKAKRNCGQIKIGTNSIVKNVNGNFGKIKIGAHSVVPEITGNFGQIQVGPNCEAATSRSKTNFGQIVFSKDEVEEPSGPTAVAAASAPPPDYGFCMANGAVPEVNTGSNGKTGGDGDGGAYPDLGTFSGKSTCAICMERGRNIAFLCGHTCCQQCADGMTLCHMCRVPIERKIRLYD